MHLKWPDLLYSLYFSCHTLALYKSPFHFCYIPILSLLSNSVFVSHLINLPLLWFRRRSGKYMSHHFMMRFPLKSFNLLVFHLKHFRSNGNVCLLRQFYALKALCKGDNHSIPSCILRTLEHNPFCALCPLKNTYRGFCNCRLVEWQVCCRIGKLFIIVSPQIYIWRWLK